MCGGSKEMNCQKKVFPVSCARVFFRRRRRPIIDSSRRIKTAAAAASHHAAAAQNVRKRQKGKTRLGVHGERRRCQNNHIPNEGARVGSSKKRSKSVVGRGSFPQGRTAEKERRGHKSVFPSSSVWGKGGVVYFRMVPL